MSKKKRHQDEHVDETWLLPYSDLLTLLLALFIVMFSISNIDKEKYEKLSEQFNVIFSEAGGVLEGSGTIVINEGTGPGNIDSITLEDDKMIEIKEKIEDEINRSGYSDKVKVVLNKDGLEIAIQEVVLFNSGEAEILQSVYPLLKQIATILKGIDNNIRVVGHTDNVPIHTEKYRSNWDLSAMRAINVMQFLVSQGGLIPERFSIEGYGEYLPKYDNSTEEGRAKNRRVEIFLARKYPLNNGKDSVESEETTSVNGENVETEAT